MQFSPLRLIAHAVFAITLLISVVAQADEMTTASGQFSGLNKHDVSGTVSIVKTDSGYEIVMSDDFVFDGAPDPKVALGKDGKYDPGTLIELLKSNTGSQRYSVPASIDVSLFNEIHIWCEKFNVGLGVAPLQ